MRVLILSQYYAPEPIPKPHELAVGLKNLGHDVSSITAIPNYPYDKIYPGYKFRLWQRETLDGIRILRLPLVPDHSRSALRRILNYTSFTASTSLLGPLANIKADVMYVWHPPLTIGLSAWVISAMKRIPFVYGVHDLWPEAIAATGISSNKTLMNGLRSLERFIYQRAFAITVVSPGFKENLIRKGVPADKIEVFTDWANESVYRPVPPDPVLATETGMAGRFNVLFGGNMGPAQGLETVIHAAERLSQFPKIQFMFAGDGIDKSRLEGLVQKKGVANVKFLGRQPAEQMPNLYALSDVLLAHFKQDPLFEISIPSKIFAYMACQRPVLMAGKGDAANLIQASGAGATCEGENPEALAQAVLTLYHMSHQERAAMGEASRRTFLEHYSQKVLLQRHEALLSQVAAHNRQPLDNLGKQ